MIKSIIGKLFEKQIIQQRAKWRKQDMEKTAAISNALPKYELTSRHLKNAKLLTDRQELLSLLPKHAVCAEIGVNEGDFSEEILRMTEPSKFYLVDAWDDPVYHNGLRDAVIKKFENEITKGQVEVRIGLSTNELPKFSDGVFDWVYLDTAHTYDVTIAELNILKTKMKPGGIIAGHDYVTGWWQGWFKYGVIEAVHELCVKENWEMLYLTTEVHQHRSFAIKKMQ
jgi:hypothetical protein